MHTLPSQRPVLASANCRFQPKQQMLRVCCRFSIVAGRRSTHVDSAQRQESSQMWDSITSTQSIINMPSGRDLQKTVIGRECICSLSATESRFD